MSAVTRSCITYQSPAPETLTILSTERGGKWCTASFSPFTPCVPKQSNRLTSSEQSQEKQVNEASKKTLFHDPFVFQKRIGQRMDNELNITISVFNQKVTNTTRPTRQLTKWCKREEFLQLQVSFKHFPLNITSLHFLFSLDSLWESIARCRHWVHNSIIKKQQRRVINET